MAWDPNTKYSWAWFTKEASIHGGVEEYIDNIRKGGYQKGHERGTIEGVVGTLIVTTVSITTYEVIKRIVEKHKAKKQEIEERSELSEAAIKKMYNDFSHMDNEEDSNNDTSYE